MTPSGTPTTIANAIERKASSIVAGIACCRSVSTGWCESWETPRSPWRRFQRYVRYCTGSGLSMPQCAWYAATASGSAEVTGPSADSAGSPGTSCVRTNATNVIPSARTTRATSRRPRNRKKGQGTRERGRPGSAPAALLRANRPHVERPDDAEDGVREVAARHNRLRRLEQREEWRPLVHAPANLPEAGGPHRVAHGPLGLLRERGQLRILARAPVHSVCGEAARRENEVVVRIRVVRAPVRLAHRVLAGRVRLEERVDGLPDEIDLDPDLGQVGLGLLRERRERDAVDRELGG